ncbi:MAG TPA: C40 family peptidase [Zeimonas sp.]
MRGSRVVAVVFVLASFGAAGSGVSSTAQAAQSNPEFVADHASPGQQLVLHSLSLIGVRYRLGGNSPETGLDCSGLVRYVFDEVLGFALPRRSEEMSRTGTPVSLDRLQPGDLVFFNTLRRAFSHVGIYIGDKRFVHAPSSGGRVRVESIASRYWARRFNGARRVAPEASSPAPGLLYAGGNDSTPDAPTIVERVFAAPIVGSPQPLTNAGAPPATKSAASEAASRGRTSSLLDTIYAY